MINVTTLHPANEATPRVRTHVQVREDGDGPAVDSSMLRSYVERAARLHEERKALADDIADILQEAASNGFDKGSLKKAVQIFMETPDKRAKRAETDAVLAVYLAALGIAQ